MFSGCERTGAVLGGGGGGGGGFVLGELQAEKAKRNNEKATVRQSFCIAL
jgi:hypothetical protein